MARTIAGFGAWASPLTAARVTAGALRFDHLVVDGDELYWAEGRASEGGRSVVVRRTRDGQLTDATPAGFNVRTRVHEYGGAAYTVHRGVIYFSNFEDQRLYRLAATGTPTPLTPAGVFYADPRMHPGGRTLFCVREDHRAPGEPTNTIVGVAVDDGNEHVMASGADFYSNPRISRDGRWLAWLQWNHPQMPWDGTELWAVELYPDGCAGVPWKVTGGASESIFQPEWSPDGELYYVSDRTGWWNLYRQNGEALCPMPAEFGKPQWTFSQSTYGFIERDAIAATYSEDGRWKLGILTLSTRSFAPVDLDLEPTDGVRVAPGALYFIGGSPTHPPCVARVALTDDRSGVGETVAIDRDIEVIRAATVDQIPREWISVAASVAIDSPDGDVHAFYYGPRNPDYQAADGERPPLLVLSHGGPTAASSDVLDARIQFWTSRGFAVLDVNYRGSTGFGRSYRDRLKGQWGIIDVIDCVNGATALSGQGLADSQRLIIRGGSAGGYTTLAALTFHNVFRAGASHYGVSDVEVLARDTHKFESRYLDSLIGPYPERRDLYRARSPLHSADRLSAALILFQGLEDKVVPPNQAEMMAAAVRANGLPVAYVAFDGEQHGFRKAENIIRCLEAELYFYGAVLGFTPADRIVPVTIDNL
jgi:dipeptidyl aminopeptidase/acylaminoacyl peptidase